MRFLSRIGCVIAVVWLGFKASSTEVVVAVAVAILGVDEDDVVVSVKVCDSSAVATPVAATVFASTPATDGKLWEPSPEAAAEIGFLNTVERGPRACNVSLNARSVCWVRLKF